MKAKALAICEIKSKVKASKPSREQLE